MATETQPAPQITIIDRIGSIPLVNDSLTTIHSTLSTNAYTSYPYAHAQAISKTALGYTVPIQARLAPVIVKADSYANAAVDVVESRYPYPFKVTTNEVVKDLKDRSDAAKGVASKTIDQRVTSPAYSVAAGIDQRFAPLVDVFEVYVNRLAPSHAPEPSTSSSDSGEAKFQYQRALDLSKSLRDNLYVFSNEQIKQLQSQSVLVQRATTTAETISNQASAQYVAAHGKVNALSDTMLAELQSIKESTAQLPAHLQASFHTIQTELSSTIHDLTAILSSQEIPPREKFNRVTATVQERVQPLLDATTARIQSILARKEQGKAKATEGAETLDSEARHAAASLVDKTKEGEAHAVDVKNAAQETGISYADKAKLNGDETSYAGVVNGA